MQSNFSLHDLEVIIETPRSGSQGKSQKEITFNDLVQKSQKKNKRDSTSQIIIEERQPSSNVQSFQIEMHQYQKLNENMKCPICKEVFTDPIILPCYHSQCKDCARRQITNQQTVNKLPRCCECNQEFSRRNIQPNVLLGKIVDCFKNIRQQNNLYTQAPNMDSSINAHKQRLQEIMKAAERKRKEAAALIQQSPERINNNRRSTRLSSQNKAKNSPERPPEKMRKSSQELPKQNNSSMVRAVKIAEAQRAQTRQRGRPKKNNQQHQNHKKAHQLEIKNLNPKQNKALPKSAPVSKQVEEKKQQQTKVNKKRKLEEVQLEDNRLKLEKNAKRKIYNSGEISKNPKFDKLIVKMSYLPEVCQDKIRQLEKKYPNMVINDQEFEENDPYQKVLVVQQTEFLPKTAKVIQAILMNIPIVPFAWIEYNLRPNVFNGGWNFEEYHKKDLKQCETLFIGFEFSFGVMNEQKMSIKELKDYLSLSGGFMHKKSRSSNRTPHLNSLQDHEHDKIKITISTMKGSTFKQYYEAKKQLFLKDFGELVFNRDFDRNKEIDYHWIIDSIHQQSLQPLELYYID